MVTAGAVGVADTAVTGTGAVTTEGSAMTTPEVVDGAVTTPLFRSTAFVNGVVLTASVVPAGGVAEVIDNVPADTLGVGEAVVAAVTDPNVGIAIDAAPPAPLVITGTGVELIEVFTVS